MVDTLTTAEIDHLLRHQHIGRLGVAAAERVYIFPIAYGYDGTDLYSRAHVGAHGGLKVQLMRAEPAVCVEVEEIMAPGHWRTVLVHGRYEELTDADARDVAIARIATQAGRAYPPSLAPYTGDAATLIVYRVRVEEITGRAEQVQIYDWPFGSNPPA